MNKILVTLVIVFCTSNLFSQTVYPLVPGIAVDSVMAVQPGASKMAFDAVSGHLFYCSSDGNTVGQTIKTIPVSSENEVTIEKAGLANGIYIVQLQSKGRLLAAEKLIVE